MSKYIIDIDALKECIKLLPKKYDGSNFTTVRAIAIPMENGIG